MDKDKKYTSIRTKLLLSFAIVIIILLTINITFIILHLAITKQYEEVTNRLMLENKFVVLVPDLTDSYFSIISGTGSKVRQEKYYSVREEINHTIFELDSMIVDKESQVPYYSMKTFVRNIVKKCDYGLQENLNGNITGASQVYQDDIIPMKPFITDATSKLMISELKYAETLQKNVQNTNNIIIMASLIILFILVLAAILFVVSTSNKITLPLIRLSDLAKDIAGGNLKHNVDEDLLKREDEIGSLSNSFNEMLKKINVEIDSQKDINQSLKNTELELESKNKELDEREKQLLSFNTLLENANIKLTALDKQKDEFISVAAHELKTPLTSIRGFSEVMHDDAILADVEKSKHYLDLISKNTNRLYDLVLDLVDSSRLSVGKLKLNMEEVNVDNLFNDIKENMSYSITTKGLIADFKIEPNLPHIQADYERVMQVLRNLISNSVKFTTSGMIALNICREGDFVKFIVKDTGQGIPKENYEYIFSRFYQVDSSATRKVGGSGLGLSICKGLVENMGGKIWFESELGKGSTFYFTIPIKK